MGLLEQMVKTRYIFLLPQHQNIPNLLKKQKNQSISSWENRPYRGHVVTVSLGPRLWHSYFITLRYERYDTGRNQTTFLNFTPEKHPVYSQNYQPQTTPPPHQPFPFLDKNFLSPHPPILLKNISNQQFNPHNPGKTSHIEAVY